MAKLEDYSRHELKEMAKEKGLTDFHNLSKANLIKALLKADEKQEEAVEKLVEKISTDLTVPLDSKGGFSEPSISIAEDLKKANSIPTRLSIQAEGWQKQIAKTGLTPEEYLKKYPDHRDKKYIEELIKFNNGK